ncbi:hypothetical protein ABL78_3753 [Leptomonas seymouri]|uniref:Uncharacterized protein n=1 Tax=Leptomonas seymouri TaxID=5684 RepID=A0A0N1PBY4_LEPSE|nr:hypothetical protein ABL78_3753 [Leptomonas seymouri]|eukprot:KPI87151.1 hypothetical protein ABL78_3753 [Leptomonas seymouri]
MTHFASVEALIHFVEGQSHHQRCKTLLDVGRASVVATPSESATLRGVICELAQPSQVHYYRLLAAYAVRGAFAESKTKCTPIDDAIWSAALSLLDDPSEKVAQLVMTPLLTAAPSPSSAAFSPSSFVVSARLPQFKAFVAKVRHVGRLELLVHLYESKATSDPVKQQYLLGHLPPENFERLSEEDQASLDSAALRHLCRFHGAWVAQYLTRRVESQVTATKTVDPLLRRHVLQAFTFLSSSGSRKQALTLFSATAHLIGLRQQELSKLLSVHFLRAFPREVGSYLLDGEGSKMMATFKYPLECALSRHAAKRLRGHADLVLRMMERGILQSIRRNPSCLPPEVRQHIYNTQRSSMAGDNDELLPEHVERLPRVEDRMAEARAGYAHRALQDDPHGRLRYLRFLPFPVALKLGEAHISSSDVAIRIFAVDSLLQSLQYFPAHVGAALDFCLRRTKEQDPWRTSMFQAWSDLPHGFWRCTSAYLPDATLLEKFQVLIDATYSASDLSGGTLSSVQHLLCNLVGPHPEFALPRLVQLIGKRKEFSSVLDSTKPFGYVALQYPEVLPAVATALLRVALEFLQDAKYYVYVHIVEVFLSKSQEHVARALLHRASTIGAQKASVQELVKTVLNAGMNSSSTYVASAAFDLYYRHFPAQTLAGLPALLERNLDWVTQEEVQNIVCSILQGQLLDRLVKFIPNVPTGRFYESEDKERLYFCQLPLSYAYRWTAHQQQTYAETILHLLYIKGDMRLFQARDLVTAMARLPSVSTSTAWTSPEGVSYSLLTLATEKHPEHGDYLKGFALHAMGLLVDDAAAVTALQTALLAPESRMDALRALTRTLRRASSAEALRVLEPLLTGKHVTAQKEALHLLGSKCDELSYKRLVRFAAEQRLPMPNVDAAGFVIPNSTTDDGEKSASLRDGAAATGAAPRVMHRDVRTALVASLFNYLMKPQVWAYFDCLLEWDRHSAQTTNNSGDAKSDFVVAGDETAEGNHDPVNESEEGNDEEDAEEKSCQSAAACEAMTMLPWINLRLPWQLCRYQTLLTGLLRHPRRPVSVAALNKLATVPPYTKMELCEAAAAYLEDCTNPRLVRSALQCMMSCTADEAVPFIVSAILKTQEDTCLQTIANVFTSLASQADAPMQPRYCSVADGVVAQLTAARRQPTITVQFISELPPAQLVAQLTTLERAGILHPGAAYAVVELVRNGGSLMRHPKEAEAFELSTLRQHSSALLRRIGLEVVLQAQSREGWTDERRAAVVAYCQDSDLWVSCDARVVRMV